MIYLAKNNNLEKNKSKYSQYGYFFFFNFIQRSSFKGDQNSKKKKRLKKRHDNRTIDTNLSGDNQSYLFEEYPKPRCPFSLLHRDTTTL